jgi:hypothetical protein
MNRFVDTVVSIPAQNALQTVRNLSETLRSTMPAEINQRDEQITRTRSTKEYALRFQRREHVQTGI